MFTKPKLKTKNTMSREEYEKTLKSLQDQIEELKKVEVVDDKPKKGEIWKPASNENYYIYYAGHTSRATNTETVCDENRFIDFEYYKTEEEAFHMGMVHRYTEMFRKYVEEHDEPLDWEDSSKCKYYIYWSYSRNCFGYGDDVNCKSQGIIYSSSKAILDDAIKFVGGNNVKKYVLGVIDD